MILKLFCLLKALSSFHCITFGRRHAIEERTQLLGKNRLVLEFWLHFN